MDQKIWKHLPTDLIRKIVHEADLSIDARLAFKIPPKKLDFTKSWRLWFMLTSHDGLVYHLETKSLHILRIPGHYVVHRPITLNRFDGNMWIFNETEEPHTVETTCSCGCFYMEHDVSDPFYTEMNVLLRGSGLVPATPTGRT